MSVEGTTTFQTDISGPPQVFYMSEENQTLGQANQPSDTVDMDEVCKRLEDNITRYVSNPQVVRA